MGGGPRASSQIMKFTHRPDIPAVILRALMDDTYSQSLREHMVSLPPNAKGCQSISVTTLPRSPRQRILTNRHSDKLEDINPLDGMWKMWGHSTHSVLERFKGPNDITEQRDGLVLTIKGKKYYLHGQADMLSPQQGGIWWLDDYKVTKDTALLYGTKSENVAQVNVLRYIFQRTRNKDGKPLKPMDQPMRISQLRNIYLLREWDYRLAESDKTGRYPKEPVVPALVEVWPDEVTEAYIKDHIEAHFNNDKKPDHELPLCTDEERWMSQPIYKIYKIEVKGENKGKPQKLAKFTASSQEAVDDWLADPVNDKDAGGTEIEYMVKTIPGKPNRCAWCDIHQFCGQYQAEVKQWAAQQQADAAAGAA